MMQPLKRTAEAIGEKRMFWADLIRIVAIFLVVYIHQLNFLPPPLTIGTMWMWIPNLYAQAGMPLFVMISGALLLGRDESTAFFFEKRVRRVFIPWIFWVSIYIIIDHFVSGVDPGSIRGWIRLCYVEFMSRFWFLPMIFGLYLLAPLLRRVVAVADERRMLYAIAVWFAVFSILPAILRISGAHGATDTSILRQVLQYSGFFLLGYLFVVKKFWQIHLRFWIMVLLCSLFSTYIAVFLSSLGRNTIDPFFYGIFSVTMVPGMAATFMCLYFFSKKFEKNIAPSLRVVIVQGAKVSLGIYLSHQLVQDILITKFPYVENSVRHLPPLIAMPVAALIVFTISFCFMLFFKKLPVLNEVV